ncbi:hypothetical protein pdam_00007512 [Pocillopora damicornis]|uniref:HYR domain-containing protein n=1 Tax=Pocillopora damicornis TaxID=46731 RepID=A0A3M6TGU0_POCDA|nr:hypothetical protein pdam_00007512 [Pocillopora damicornis]
MSRKRIMAAKSPKMPRQVSHTRPPVFNCPPNLKVNTLKGKSTGKVAWSVQVSDNSGDVDPNAVIKIESNHKSGQELPIGVTAIRVTAIDQAGNEAMCTFAAEVIGARHEVTKNPFQTWEDGLMFLLVKDEDIIRVGFEYDLDGLSLVFLGDEN